MHLLERLRHWCISNSLPTISCEARRRRARAPSSYSQGESAPLAVRKMRKAHRDIVFPLLLALIRNWPYKPLEEEARRSQSRTILSDPSTLLGLDLLLLLPSTLSNRLGLLSSFRSSAPSTPATPSRSARLRRRTKARRRLTIAPPLQNIPLQRGAPHLRHGIQTPPPRHRPVTPRSRTRRGEQGAGPRRVGPRCNDMTLPVAQAKIAEHGGG